MGYQIGKKLEEKVLYELGNADADLSAATGTLTLFSIPANTIIHSVRAWVETAVTGATSEIVGDGTDTNGFLEDGFAASTGVYPLYNQDAASTFVGAYQLDSTDGATDAADVSIVPANKFYATADTIDFIIGGTATAGKIHFFVEFTRLA